MGNTKREYKIIIFNFISETENSFHNRISKYIV